MRKATIAPDHARKATKLKAAATWKRHCPSHQRHYALNCCTISGPTILTACIVKLLPPTIEPSKRDPFLSRTPLWSQNNTDPATAALPRALLFPQASSCCPGGSGGHGHNDPQRLTALSCHTSTYLNPISVQRWVRLKSEFRSCVKVEVAVLGSLSQWALRFLWT